MNALHASNKLISIYLITIPSLMNAVLNPVISTYSDKYRSRWGRRIPLLVFSAPFIVVFLILAGFAPEIGTWVHSHFLASSGISRNALTLGLLGVVLVIYRFFNFFTTTIFYYLFNDVVPEHFLGRFMTGFRAFAVVAQFAFSMFIFKYAEHDARWIFLGLGLLYLCGFTLMCLKVKEGEYPPAPELIGKKPGFFAVINTYIQECFTHKFYWTWFMVYGLYQVAFIVQGVSAFGTFFLLMQKQTFGLTMTQIGHLGAIGAVISFIVLYPAGVLSDKYHPIRVFIFSMVGVLVTASAFSIVILGFKFSQPMAYTIMLVFTAISMPLATIAVTALIPLAMRMLPRRSYGQFCSAAAMVGALLVALAGPIIGALLDYAKQSLHGNLAYYKYVTLWTPLFCITCLIASCVLFRMWQKFGGDASFCPPDPRERLAGRIVAGINSPSVE
jgi:MFS family permease